METIDKDEAAEAVVEEAVEDTAEAVEDVTNTGVADLASRLSDVSTMIDALASSIEAVNTKLDAVITAVAARGDEGYTEAEDFGESEVSDVDLETPVEDLDFDLKEN